MTGPIKPPGGATPSPPIPDGGSPIGARSSEFRDALNETASVEAVAGSARSELEALAEQLRTGQLTPAQAIDVLVDRALSGPMAQGLAPEARAGLEAHLRATLADDPALAQMVGDLERNP